MTMFTLLYVTLCIYFILPATLGHIVVFMFYRCTNVVCDLMFLLYIAVFLHLWRLN